MESVFKDKFGRFPIGFLSTPSLLDAYPLYSPDGFWNPTGSGSPKKPFRYVHGNLGYLGIDIDIDIGYNIDIAGLSGYPGIDPAIRLSGYRSGYRYGL